MHGNTSSTNSRRAVILVILIPYGFIYMMFWFIKQNHFGPCKHLKKSRSWIFYCQESDKKTYTLHSLPKIISQDTVITVYYLYGTLGRQLMIKKIRALKIISTTVTVSSVWSYTPSSLLLLWYDQFCDIIFWLIGLQRRKIISRSHTCIGYACTTFGYTL